MTCCTRRERWTGSGSSGRIWAAARRGIWQPFFTPYCERAFLRSDDAGGVERPADDLVAHARQVLDAAAADEHDRVLLQVVALAGDVGGDLDRAGDAHARDLAQRRVRLLRRHRVDARADAAPLRRGDLALAALAGLQARRRELLLRRAGVRCGRAGRWSACGADATRAAARRYRGRAAAAADRRARSALIGAGPRRRCSRALRRAGRRPAARRPAHGPSPPPARPRLYVEGGALYGCLGARADAARRGARAARRARRDAGRAPRARQPLRRHRHAARWASTRSARRCRSSTSRSGATRGQRAGDDARGRAPSRSSTVDRARDRRRGGTLAWIGSRSAVGAFTPIYEVHTLTVAGRRPPARERRRRSRRGSLALRGETVSWRQGGRERSAAI